MPMVWNDQADAKLLVAIITKTDGRLNWASIAEYMGPECSASAVQHRVQRLKDKVKANNPIPANNGGENGSEGTGPITPTPEKRKRGRPTRIVPAANENENPADAEEEGGSPTKMQRGVNAKAVSKERGLGKGNGKIKKEDGKEDSMDENAEFDADLKIEEGDDQYLA
ncbi:hypothetical protein BDW62DRAFT_187964 [Aspergillus aurantiobrunneus]